MNELDQLVDIVVRLRSEGGCPWDRAQTEATMRTYLLEEAHEVLDAIDTRDDSLLEKELGDLLFTTLMVARIGEERGATTIGRVAERISEKMIRRHPHVFAPEGADQGSALGDWERRKSTERRADESALDGIPVALPALLRAHRVSEKVGALGFDWPDAPAVREKVTEELAELDEAVSSGDPAAMADELGDLLFALVNYGRHLGIPAEDALRQGIRKFEGRFRKVEGSLAAEGLGVHEVGADELDRRWRKAKEG